MELEKEKENAGSLVDQNPPLLSKARLRRT